MGIGRVTLIVFSIVTIFSIGSSTIPAHANITEFTDNFVHVLWSGPFDPSGAPIPPNIYVFDDTPLSAEIPIGQPTMSCIGDLCTIELPNFIDELDTKIIEIDVVYFANNAVTMIIPSVTCHDSTGDSAGILIYEQFVNSLVNTVFYDFECLPNPDSETIVITLDANVEFIEIWTVSFDDTPVGGTSIPIDTSALLLAGAASISMWMIPVVIAGIGIGIFVIKRRN